MIIAIDAKVVEAMIPNAGTPALFIRLKRSGNRPSLAAARGISAQIKWRRADQQLHKTPRFLRDMIVAILALVFSILFIVYSRNTGHSVLVIWAPFILAAGAFALGIPVYNKHRTHMTEPAPVPPYSTGPADDAGTNAASEGAPPTGDGGSAA